MRRSTLSSFVVGFVAATAALAASPPALINYQGVLRGSNDAPLSGSYDMTFTFFDAATAGTEIMIDAHRAADANPVTVSGGLFDTQLGGGVVTDGSGAGTYTSLSDLFRDYSAVYVQITIGTETLTPRTRVVSSAYAQSAQNAQNAQVAQDSNALGGRAASDFLDTSSAYQGKPGQLDVGSTVLAGQAMVIRNAGPAPSAVLVSYETGTSVELTGAAQAGSFTANSSANGIVARSIDGIGAWGRSDSNFGVRGDSPGWWGVAGTGLRGGGAFASNDGTSHAQAGVEGGTAFYGRGDRAGAEFRTDSSSAYAFLAYDRTGIAAYSVSAGDNPGWFQDFSAGSYAAVGKAGYKIQGNGAVSFVQNDPDDASRVVVYAAPEGDEVAVYTRGSARLVNGEARVALGPTFRKVANPDLGLTAHLTPRSEQAVLYVAQLTPEELLVRGPAGSSASFDYMVWGLRIGFEDKAVVQPKEHEAFIPSRSPDEAIYAQHPELRGFAARQRHLAERAKVEPLAKTVATERSLALENAIGVYDRARDIARIAPPDFESAADRRASFERDRASGLPEPVTTGDAAARPDTRGRPPEAVVEPALPSGSQWVAVAESVETGDLLAVGLDGRLLRSSVAGDALVFGIVAGPPGQRFSGQAPVAFAGVATACHVDASVAPIKAGDLLVSAPLPGYAAKAPEKVRDGTVVAKALEELSSGSGMIRVLVMSR